MVAAARNKVGAGFFTAGFKFSAQLSSCAQWLLRKNINLPIVISDGDFQEAVGFIPG